MADKPEIPVFKPDDDEVRVIAEETRASRRPAAP